MKINIFQGELTNVSAEKEALMVTAKPASPVAIAHQCTAGIQPLKTSASFLA